MIRPAAGGRRRTEVDRRGAGALGVLGDLMTTGESLLVVCADVSRRAALLERDLDARRFGRPEWVKLSLHCDLKAAAAALDHEGAPALTDHTTLESTPALCERFRHVLVLDPPPSAGARELLTFAGGGEGGFLHLGWGEAEIEFARLVLEHEYGLRPHLTEVYRELKSLHAGAGAVSRAALEGAGRHPRAWPSAARCMRVLAELDLARFERSSGTVSCTITTGTRADLEQSETFRACAAAAEQGLRYLKTLTSHPRAAKAA